MNLFKKAAVVGNRASAITAPATDECFIVTSPSVGSVRLEPNAVDEMQIDRKEALTEDRSVVGVRLDVITGFEYDGRTFDVAVTTNYKGGKLSPVKVKKGEQTRVGGSLSTNVNSIWNALNGSATHSKFYKVSTAAAILVVALAKDIEGNPDAESTFMMTVTDAMDNGIIDKNLRYTEKGIQLIAQNTGLSVAELATKEQWLNVGTYLTQGAKADVCFELVFVKEEAKLERVYATVDGKPMKRDKSNALVGQALEDFKAKHAGKQVISATSSDSEIESADAEEVDAEDEIVL